MPQMAPIQRTLLYLFFLTIFLLMNFYNYYMIFLKNHMINNSKILNKNYTWKW